MPHRFPTSLTLALVLITSFCALFGAASPIIYRNITKIRPSHISAKREEPKLTCSPGSVLDLVIFFIGNYLAHAVTVITYPGESSTAELLSFLAALTFPASGLVRGFNAIRRHAMFTKGSLARAAKSGALCMVVRNDPWMPLEHGFHLNDMRLVSRAWSPSFITAKTRGGPSLSSRLRVVLEDIPVVLKTSTPPWLGESSSWSFQDTRNFYIGPRRVQGTHCLPPGYSFAYVPRNAKVVGLVPDVNPELASSRSVPKAVIGIIQIVFSSFTLYRSRAALINHLGYASYSLTVLPYAVLTFVNLVGNLLTPEYPALYLVQSETLLEAQKRPGAAFHGIVGKLVSVNESQRPQLDGLSGSFQLAVDQHGAIHTQVVWDESCQTLVLQEELEVPDGQDDITHHPTPTPAVEGPSFTIMGLEVVFRARKVVEWWRSARRDAQPEGLDG
ncbi:hypothetical protein C8J57DRAFT_1181345 [Mycena rebaudengoi]|nr:hypothetical protein C8J57DRAFT_1181345 [Mycena rebaudengoi]